MTISGYNLSAQAASAARGDYTPPKQPVTISRAAKARAGRPAVNDGPSPMALMASDIYTPYKYPDGIYPDDVAMDSCQPINAPGMSNWATSSLFHEGQGFFGFPYLAELMQRVEYRHACEIWAEHAIRKWIKITGGSDKQREAIEAEFVRLKVRSVVHKWLLHDQGFGRGQIFLDFGDADKTEELALPLVLKPTKIGTSRPLQALTNVEPMWSAPGTYATSNPLRPDFYKPSAWFVWGRTVHASRMLTIASRPVSDMLKPAYAFGGQSLVQIMKPYVDNWLRTRQAVSDLINSFSIVNFQTDMSSVLGGQPGDGVWDRADMFVQSRDNRGIWLTDKDNELLTSLAVPLGGLHELQAQSQEHQASAARIPLSIYLQITPTGLNATNDGETRNFYADVHSYQEEDVRPGLQTIFEAVQLSLFDKIIPDMKFEFVALWEMSDKDKSDIRKADADADIGYVTAGIIDPEEVRERLSNDETSLYHGVDLSDPAPGYGNDGIDSPPGGEDDSSDGAPDD